MGGGEPVGEVRPVDLGGEEAKYGSCDADTVPSRETDQRRWGRF